LFLCRGLQCAYPSAIIRAVNTPSLWRTGALLTVALAATAALAGGNPPAADGLQLSNQTIAGFVAPGRVLLADSGSSRFGLGLTQAGGSFNLVLPGAAELGSDLTASGTAGIVPCKEVAVTPSNLKVLTVVQMLVLNTTNVAKQKTAGTSGKLILADSQASATAIGDNTPPDQGRYLIYLYADSASTMKGECAITEGSEPPIRPTLDLTLKLGWNQVEFAVKKDGDVFILALKNASDTSGFKWYFIKNQ
jgi:hypothetical protein